MSDEKLLPCPHCGGFPGWRHSHDPDGCYWVHVECGQCGARTRGKWCSSRSDADPAMYQEARDEWNRRVAQRELSDAELIALANQHGIDTDTEGDIWGSTNGALLKFARALAAGGRQ